MVEDVTKLFQDATKCITITDSEHFIASIPPLYLKRTKLFLSIAIYLHHKSENTWLTRCSYKFVFLKYRDLGDKDEVLTLARVLTHSVCYNLNLICEELWGMYMVKSILRHLKGTKNKVVRYETSPLEMKEFMIQIWKVM